MKDLQISDPQGNDMESWEDNKSYKQKQPRKNNWITCVLRPDIHCKNHYSETRFEWPLNFSAKISRKMQVTLQKRGKISIKFVELHKGLTSQSGRIQQMAV